MRLFQPDLFYIIFKYSNYRFARNKSQFFPPIVKVTSLGISFQLNRYNYSLYLVKYQKNIFSTSNSLSNNFKFTFGKFPNILDKCLHVATVVFSRVYNKVTTRCYCENVSYDARDIENAILWFEGRSTRRPESKQFRAEPEYERKQRRYLRRSNFRGATLLPREPNLIPWPFS